MRQASLPLDQPFSLYLDLARFLAALAVVSSHFVLKQVAGGAMGELLPSFGREAVITFFVLSGFVIAYTTERKGACAREYVLARCTRIYSVVIPALVLALACIVLLPVADAYQAAYQLERPILYLPLHLLFLGQSWTLAEVPLLLLPYWSLCYEVWYYVLFGVAFYLRGRLRVCAVALVLAVMGYKLWLLLPVWLSGVALYHLQARCWLPQALARVGLAASLVALAAYNASGLEVPLRALGTAIWPFASLKLGSADRYLADYLVCLIVLANFGCARFANLGALLPHARLIRYCSSYTFTLYLTHMIVIMAWMALYPHDRDSLLDVLGLSLAIALATLLVGQVSEQRKEMFRTPFAWLARAVIR